MKSDLGINLLYFIKFQINCVLETVSITYNNNIILFCLNFKV